MPVRVVKIEGMDELVRALDRLQVDVENVLEEAAQAGAKVIMEAANQQAPAPNINMETEEKSADSVTIAIGPDKDHWYYKFAESGTQPHEITPATAGALVFEGAGGLVVTKEVAHTGMAARPFLRPAADENEGRATEAVGEVIKRAVE
jgi:HK97 gp10 family phage protein